MARRRSAAQWFTRGLKGGDMNQCNTPGRHLTRYLQRMTDAPTSRSCALNIAVLTVSDTRTLADDRSGTTLAERIAGRGPRTRGRAIVPDDVAGDPRHGSKAWIADKAIDVVDHHRRHRLHRPRRDAGSGGAAVREAHGRLLDGVPWCRSRRSAPRRCRAGPTAGSPTPRPCSACRGSPGACRDAWDEILVHQLDVRHKPCNFVEILPRLDEHLKRAKAKGATV